MSDAEPAFRYTAALAAEIEQRWQDRWEAAGTFHAPNPAGELAGAPARGVAEQARGVAEQPKLYVLDMFPYPSGSGLHVGHPLGYIATDVIGRFHRMDGVNVLHALGYDAFGLPAEQYAVQTGQHPRVTTEANIATMRRQLRRLGLAHDDRRSVATTDVEFYRWTQWIFTKVFDAWYDPHAPRPDGGVGRARPMSELVDELASGARPTPDGRAWAELALTEQRAVLDASRLAYLDEAPVNWCPGLGTVLANEEVTAEGRSEVGNFPVFKRSLRQWMMRITAYADRLLEDLDRLDWPEPIKLMQRNWIGRSEGALVRFATTAGDLEVFTTRPDTLFGATFMVLAPEHPSVPSLTGEQWPAQTREAWTGGAATPRQAVEDYRRAAALKTEVERQTEHRDKTGVFTGSFATNPSNGEQIPVFVADYVLMGYGTGAIMAVPGQDERDWEFAEQFDLPIIRTVSPPAGFEGEAYTGEGPAINSANDEISLDGLAISEAKRTMIDWLQARGRGTPTITYKLRDWLFSRQRYWGEPFPIVYPLDGPDEGLPTLVPADQLPVLLPEVSDYAPRSHDPQAADSVPEAPLDRADEWVQVTLDLGDGPRRYQRETNVMPQWAGSCWYEIRYLDPTNSEAFVDKEVEEYWMGPRSADDVGGVDLYVGGVEHAVLHLLYARFWHKVLHDLGELSSAEPFRRLFNQGYIQAYAFTDARGSYVPAVDVLEDATSSTGFRLGEQEVRREYGKMGKSLKNAVTPDEMFAEFGADTLRLYEMSMGPLDASRPWETRAVVGAFRFLQRVWRNVVDEQTGEPTVVDVPMQEETCRILHRTIDAVRSDIPGMRMNTAVARLIEYNNHLTKLDPVPRDAAEALLLMLAPLAPHCAEELWARLGHPESLAYEPFPVPDPQMLVEETVTCAVQVQGKLRDRLEVPPGVAEQELRELALASPAVQRVLGGRDVRTVIVRAPRLVNVVPA